MVLIADLDGRLLIPFCVWLGSIVARPNCKSNMNFKIRFSLARFVLFFVNSVFCLSTMAKNFEESMLNLRICSTKGYIFKRNKEELSKGNQQKLKVFEEYVIARNPCSA